LPKKKRAEPQIVKIFRQKYPDSTYLDIFDKGLLINKKRKPADRKWLIEQMKLYHRIQTKEVTYHKSKPKNKEVVGLMKYA